MFITALMTLMPMHNVINVYGVCAVHVSENDDAHCVHDGLMRTMSVVPNYSMSMMPFLS
jgi:hypothetical protein